MDPIKKFGVDVVILPPDPIMDKAIKYNQKLLTRRPGNIVLGKTRYFPHVSLVMGCLREDQLKTAVGLLDALSRRQAPELYLAGIRTVNSGPNNVVSFDIELNAELMELHTAAVTAFGPLLTQDATDADLSDGPPIEPSTVQWINRFIPYACFENFWPHITLGFGDYSNGFKPVSFKAFRLAICHLGNYCTCAKILAEVNFKL